MDKVVYTGSILISSTLLAGSVFFADSAAMWLASTSVVMNVARVLLVVMMLGLLLTDPPRSRQFRAILAVAGLGFAGWAIARLFSGSVQLIDAVLFLEVSIAFGLAAIEGEPLPTKVPASHLAFASSIAKQDFIALYSVAILAYGKLMLPHRLSGTTHFDRSRVRMAFSDGIATLRRPILSDTR